MIDVRKRILCAALVLSACGLAVACGSSQSTDLFGAGGDGGGSGEGGGSSGGGDGSANDSGSGDDGGGSSSGGDGGGGKDAGKDARGGDGGDLCTSTGGTVTTALCCNSVSSFPDTCKVGACGCSPANSHTVASCTCPLNECYDAVAGCRAH